MDITSFLIGKEVGGGSAPTPTYQDKEITITQNGEQTITADEGYDALSSVEITTNIPQPSGKITITENGTDIDISSYATADVSVGSSSISTLEDYNLAIKNATDGFANFVNNDYNNTKTAYTNNSVSLYSPGAEFKRYMVYKDNNNKYKVAWVKNHIFFTDNYTSFSAGSIVIYYYGGIFTNSNGELEPTEYTVWGYNNSGKWQDNLYVSNQSFDNVADLISAMQNNTLTYSFNSSPSYKEILYCNYIFGYYKNDVIKTISTGIISHNETIITMS